MHEECGLAGVAAAGPRSPGGGFVSTFEWEPGGPGRSVCLWSPGRTDIRVEPGRGERGPALRPRVKLGRSLPCAVLRRPPEFRLALAPPDPGVLCSPGETRQRAVCATSQAVRPSAVRRKVQMPTLGQASGPSTLGTEPGAGRPGGVGGRPGAWSSVFSASRAVGIWHLPNLVVGSQKRPHM